jgi:anhydro-N-acetylmuramic acid kinase
MPLYIGLMSGTSMDGVDAVLTQIGDSGIRVLDRIEHVLPQSLASRLDAALDFAALPAVELVRLDAVLGAEFAAAARALLETNSLSAEAITAIGSHGQTLFHEPDGEPPVTVQVGDPNIIAARTGITVVADFRRRDLALGGQGAPLAPAFHQAAFGGDAQRRCVVNIGGIANITACDVPTRGTACGFDSGPGNTLLDQWCLRHTGAEFDMNGAWGRTGTTLSRLLERMLADPYFARPSPKSTGREYFNPQWLVRHLDAFPAADARDVQRTLTELTARSIADACRASMPDLEAVYVCGGGALNELLMSCLHEALGNVQLDSTLALGIAPKDVEGAAFAWLAHRTLRGEPGNLPAVTGASEVASLGGVFQGRSGISRYPVRC